MLIRYSMFFLVLAGFLNTAYGGFDEAEAAYGRHDFKAALSELQPLTEQGLAKAQLLLGLMYYQGQGVPQDYKEAIKLARLAAEQGDANAQNFVGLMYYNGHGVLEDYKETFKWYRLAAEQGSAAGQGMLSSLYYKGIGVPKDYMEAYAWASVAVANGSVTTVKNRDIIRDKLTPAELEKGQALAKQYFNAYQSKR